MKVLATTLLFLVAVVFALCEQFKTLYPGLRWLEAFAEAALVGGMADWFAVTALFRRPLGLPIPHTALVPTNQGRIADALAEFVHSNFLAEPVLRRKLEELETAQRLGAWLDSEENINALLDRLFVSLPDFFRTVPLSAARDLLIARCEEALRDMQISSLAGAALEKILDSDQSQAFTTETLRLLELALQEHEITLREMIERGLPWYVPKFLHNKVYRDFISKLRGGIMEMNASPTPAGRQVLIDNLRRLARDLQESSQWQRWGRDCAFWLVENQALRGFISALWERMKEALLAGEGEGILLRHVVRQGLIELREPLKNNKDVQQVVNTGVIEAVISLANARRGWVSSLISDTMRHWDARTLVEKIEGQVSNDLQYIRLNGMIVGGLVGLVLYALRAG